MASEYNLKYNVRSYRNTDRPAVRTINGTDEFARPQLASKYPRMSEYLADEASYSYSDFEPESRLRGRSGRLSSGGASRSRGRFPIWVVL